MEVGQSRVVILPCMQHDFLRIEILFSHQMAGIEKDSV